MSKKKPAKKPKGFIPGAHGWDQTAKSYPIKSSRKEDKNAHQKRKI